MGGINISGRIKQSFYPRTRHGELKVISMIYAPPYLIRRPVTKVKSIDHELATSPNVPAEAHTKETLESNQRASTLLLRSNTRSKGITRSTRQHKTSHYGIAPTVENGY